MPLHLGANFLPRMVFAVVCMSSVLVYDTQHAHPIAKVGGIHYATINDAAWSKDGSMLIVCSSDGYITFIHFSDCELGSYYICCLPYFFLSYSIFVHVYFFSGEISSYNYRQFVSNNLPHSSSSDANNVFDKPDI